MRSVILCMAIEVVFAGCAFKPSAKPPTQAHDPHEAPAPLVADPSPSPSPEPSPIVGSADPQIQISWNDGDPLVRPIVDSDKKGAFTTSAGVTLPPVVPDEITVSMLLPKSITLPKELLLDAQGVSPDDNAGTKYQFRTDPGVFDLTKSGAKLDFDISGLRTVLRDDREGRLYLELKLSDAESGAEIATVTLPLMTPPSEIGVIQAHTRAYEIAMDEKLDEFYRFKTGAHQLELLQVVELANNSTDRVAVEYPGRLTGSVSAHFKEYKIVNDEDIVALRCSHTVETKEWAETYSDALYLIPLQHGIGADLPSILSQSTRVDRIDPDDILLLGIYGDGPGLSKIVDQGWTPQTHHMGVGDERCDIECRSFPVLDEHAYTPGQQPLLYLADHRMNACANNPGLNCHGDADCEACVDLAAFCDDALSAPADRTAPVTNDRQMGNQEILNECWQREWNPPKGYQMSFCPGGKFGGWYLKTYPHSEPEGVDSSPVTVNVDADSAQFKFRFDMTNEKDDPEFRTVSVLKQESEQWK